MNQHGEGRTDREDEALLVTRSRGGDAAAFEQLVRNTARWLFARLYLQVGDAHRAEDLVQETILRAWQKLPGLSDPKAFRGWLVMIANSVVMDAAKRESRKKRGGFWRSSDQQLMKLADTTPPPSESLEKDEQHARMLAVLRELPPEYRDVLTLRYLAGADYDTIGKQLALTNGSLRGLLNRGMKLLRERLAVPSFYVPGGAALFPSFGTPGEGEGGGSSGGARHRPPQPSPGVPGEGESRGRDA